MTKEEIYKRADIYVKNQPLVNANNVELKRGFVDGAIWMHNINNKELATVKEFYHQIGYEYAVKKACEYIMTHPTYAVQPEVYAEGLRKAMEG